MSKYRFALLFLLSTTAILCDCKPATDRDKQPEIAVSNSYLLSVVKDICPEQTEVMSLAPPGMCPGHFDISPSQVNQLGGCSVLLLFDFQEKMGDALSRLEERGLKIQTVNCPEGLCLPYTYLMVARKVADLLSQDNPAKKAEYYSRLELIKERTDELSTDIHKKMEESGLIDAKVAASRHQAVFADWLGLQVVALFAGSDVETPESINQCLLEARDKGARFVIANKQEGTVLATALAERLNADMVVFSNFPAGQSDTTDVPGFDRLLHENISNLLNAGE
jgi:ABC-type Zn uptake system ZnuABC Zn-binding protein ZnuA